MQGSQVQDSEQSKIDSGGFRLAVQRGAFLSVFV